MIRFYLVFVLSVSLGSTDCLLYNPDK